MFGCSYPRVVNATVRVACFSALAAATLWLWPPHAALAQEEADDALAEDLGDPLEGIDDVDALAGMSLEELLDEPVEVGATQATSIRDAPGILTVVHRDDLIAAGARDLVDVLHLVPGFFVGVDVQGTLGAGFRGIWATEGKLLVLLDGHPMNELAYLTTPIGGRIPIQLIDRVEIVRGPGTVRYGGEAELAVVNIILVDVDDDEDCGQRVVASAEYGLMAGGTARGTVSARLAGRDASGLSYSAFGHFGVSRMGNGLYEDIYGDDAYRVEDGNRFREGIAGLRLSYENFSLSYIYESYEARNRDGFDEITDPLSPSFETHSITADYRIELGERGSLTPSVAFRQQRPWQDSIAVDQTLPPAELDEAVAFRSLFGYERVSSRLQFGLTGRFDPIEELSLEAGVQFRWDRQTWNDYDAALDDPEDSWLFDCTSGSCDPRDFTNFAAYIEAQSQNDFLNVTAGIRAERHSRYGASLVPRLIVGRRFGDFHFKVQAANAFRAPGFENMGFSLNGPDDMKPERLRIFEAEVGYQFGDHVYFSVNGFDARLRNPIVFQVVEDDMGNTAEGYENFGRTGSRGLESTLRLQFDNGALDATYSFYSARGYNRVDLYRPGDAGSPRALIGAPQHKATLAGRGRVWRGLHLSGTAVLFGPRLRRDGCER